MRNSLPFFCVYPKAPPQSSRTSPDLLKGMDLIPAVFEAVGLSFFPLGKVGMELLTKAMYGWFIVDGVHLDNAVGVALSRRRYKPGGLPCSLYMPSIKETKRFAPFQGFALCVRACRIISRERTLGYSPPHPAAPA